VLKRTRRDASLAARKVELIAEPGNTRAELEKVMQQARRSARTLRKSPSSLDRSPSDLSMPSTFD
jgi:hypothetical protein